MYVRRLGGLAICLAALLLLSACTGTGDAASSGADTTNRNTSTDQTASAPDKSDSQQPEAERSGLASITDFEYKGAFLLSSETFGDSDTNYAVGTLAYHEANNSLFIAGHTQHNAVAEFEIPAQLGTGEQVDGLPTVSKPSQEFVTLLNPEANPDGINRITGMQVVDGRLLVNAENWYDANGAAKDTTLVVESADELAGLTTGYFQLDGGTRAAGFMSPVPEVWQEELGGPMLTGWASNYSIISRYSVGPSLYGFDPADLLRSQPGPINTNANMVFPYSSPMGPDAYQTGSSDAPALWNHLSKGVYGFIIPGSNTFVVVGSSGGIDSGIGYKITQDDGNLCGGYCSYKASDNYNHYWLFDLEEIASASTTDAPRPYEFGRWEVPFDGAGEHRILGATYDPKSSTLYMSIDQAGQLGQYDRPPAIVAYEVS